jgi:PAS domain S-box-containing protein
MAKKNSNKTKARLISELEEAHLRIKELEKLKGGNPGGVVGETAHKQVEQSLQEIEEKYRTVVDHSLEGIFIVQDFLIVFCNKRLAEMYGFKSQEHALGTDIRRLVSPGKLDLLEQEVKARESGKKNVSHYNSIARRIDGKEFEVEILSSRIQYKGKPAVQGVIRDVSKQIQLEAQLLRAQKMEAIGTLAGGIAHDFNNILSIILGYTEISMDNPDDKKKVQHNLKHVLKAANRAKDLVHQILSFSRQGETQKEPVKVVQVIKDALTLIRASLPSTIKIRLEIGNDNYTVFSQPTYLHQVLMNLCSNAAHAMQEKGGELTIEVSDLNRDLETISETNLAPSPYMRLTVKDTGHGMTPEVMERVFDPFFTTKQAGEGTGLGLSVVHGIVAGLDGEISVESEPGKGTSFHLFLPLLLESIDPTTERESRPSIPRGNEKILLVDDEAAVADMGCNMLEQLGYDVVAKSSSVEALDTFRANPDSFHLVITDLTMPDMTGIHLALKMFRIKPKLPVIICTGYSRELNREELWDLGIKDLILKPYNKRKIGTVVRRVLDNADHGNEVMSNE